MNPLIRKEIRLVLPAWALAMMLAILPAWFLWPTQFGLMVPSPGLLVYAPFAIGALLLAIAPFGQEISSGMFSIFLAQPVPRHRIWLIKTVVLIVALVVTLVTFCLSTHFRVESLLETMKSTAWRSAFSRPIPPDQFLSIISETRHTVFVDSLLAGGLSALAAFAGGLWTTLFFRQISAALWFALLVPTGLALLTLKIFGNASDQLLAAGLVVVIGGYSAAGYLWARKLFFQAQDALWTGGVVSMPNWLGRSATRSDGQVPRRPIRTLIRKELQANHINLILAAGLFVLHVLVLIFRRLSGSYLADHRSFAMALESVPILWLALPLMIGSIAVAEERKVGTMESSLCLPAARRVQFLIKLIMALALGIFLGGLVPLGLEALGRSLGLPSITNGVAINVEIFSIERVLLLGSVGLTLLSFYASTLTRNTLQAMGTGLLVSIIGFLVIFAASNPVKLSGGYLWSRQLIGYFGWPVMIAAILLLAYTNYKRLHSGSNIWFRNIFTLVLAMLSVGATSTAIYHRAWEAWIPEEPPHRYYPSYLAHSSNGRQPKFQIVPKMVATEFRIVAVLPDGRLWLRQAPTRLNVDKFINGFDQVSESKVGPWRSGFIPGTAWQDVAVTDLGAIALQTNGTLWDLAGIQLGGDASQAVPKPFAENGTWRSIAGQRRHFVGLRSNGTLWEWGERSSLSNKALIVTKMPNPVRVGNDADWLAICDSVYMSAAVKTDNTIWRWRHGPDSWVKDGTNVIGETPERWLILPSKPPISLSLHWGSIAAVCADGSLWFGGSFRYRMPIPDQTNDSNAGMWRWDQDMDWRRVDLTRVGCFVAIKSDGVLCEWDPRKLPWRDKNWISRPTIVPTRNRDWLAACGYGDGYLALAADGTLTNWEDRSWLGNDYYGPGASALMHSRIKARKVADIPVPYTWAE